MKCIPITLSGRLVALAIASILILEVLVASIVVGLQKESNCSNNAVLYERTSGIASTTRSASAADEFSVDVLILERAC